MLWSQEVPELVSFAAQFYDRRITNLACDEHGEPIDIAQGDPFAPVDFFVGIWGALAHAQAAIPAMVPTGTRD